MQLAFQEAKIEVLQEGASRYEQRIAALEEDKQALVSKCKELQESQPAPRQKEEEGEFRGSSSTLSRCLTLAYKRLVRFVRHDVLQWAWQLILLWVGGRHRLKDNLSYFSLKERQEELLLQWGGTMAPSR